MAGHLSAHGLYKSYRKGRNEVPVLRGVDLDVERGEMVAVVGASGSGKSTLLHLLGLLDAPDSGEVRLDDSRIDNVAEGKRDELRNGTFGFIFQFYHLLPELSALENVLMPQLISHGLWSYWRRAAMPGSRKGKDLLDRVGLGHRLAHLPSEPLGGEMASARAIARCAGRQACQGLCWPTSRPATSMPPMGRQSSNCCKRLEQAAWRWLIMILATHDMQIAQQTDRIVRLAEGRIEEWSHALA